MCIRDRPEPIQPAVQALGQLVAAFGGLAQTGDVGAFVASIQAIDWGGALAVSYTHLRAHETVLDVVCRLLLEKKKNSISAVL